MRKRISVLTVGDEILSGEILDTNFHFIAGQLSSLGLEVVRNTTAPDEIESIARCIGELLEVSNILLITGGLGPTSDDLTREALSLAVGRKLVKKDKLEKYLVDLFESFGRRMPVENLKQAYVPDGAGVIDPAGGTAAGITLEHQEKLIIALPGVPWEMKTMFNSNVMQVLTEISTGKSILRTAKLNVFGIGESDVEERLSGLIEKSVFKYGFLAGGGQVSVKVTAEAASRNEVDQLLEEEKEKIYGLLGRHVFSEGERRLEEVVSELLSAEGKTLAAAESLTAGMVCERIVNVPGSSKYFLGGVVAYSTESKNNILEIPDNVLADGAVNELVAQSMAQSIRRLFKSDIGISTTGLAGPDVGEEREPVGTVCVGLAFDGGTHSWIRRIPGDRMSIRTAAASSALNAVRLFLQNALD